MTHRLQTALDTYKKLKKQIPPATAKVLADAEDEVRAACQEVAITWPKEIGALITKAYGWLEKQKDDANAPPPVPGV